MDRQWKLVPVEPTETMVINGFESEPDECFTDEEVWEQYQEMSGCQQAAFRAKLCWAAMLSSAPAPTADEEPEVIGYRVRYEQNPEVEYLMYQEPEGLYSSEAIIVLSEHRALVARFIAERDALQQRLNEADQRIDDFAGGECEWRREDDSGIWNSGCGETWSFHEDGPEENGMHFCHSCGKHLVVEVTEQEQDDDWHMNPCKQGHRDVGAAGGVAHCYTCDEKIQAATTQEAFECWNATHPAVQV